MSRNQRGTTSRANLFRLILVGFSVAFSLFFAEIALRLVAPQATSWLAVYRPDPVLPFYSLLPGVETLVDTGETRWTVYTDAEGHRVGAPAAAKPPSTCTNLWLGDSYAFGHGLDYPLSFVGLFEASTPDTHTVNAGVAGYGPPQYRQTLEAWAAQPANNLGALYVATYVGNDFNDGIQNKNVPVSNGIIGNTPGLKSFLKRNFHLYRLASAVYHQLSSDHSNPYAKMLAALAQPAQWESGNLKKARTIYAEELEKLMTFARERGIEPSFVVIPTREALEYLRSGDARAPSAQAGTHSTDPTLPVQQARAILDALGARYVDLTPTLVEFDPEETYFLFDGHLTIKGSQLAAQAIAQGLPRDCNAAGAKAR